MGRQLKIKVQRKEAVSSKVLFGFLPCPSAIEFDGGIIPPVPEYDQVESWIDEHTNKDGFLYPPMERRVLLDPRTEEPIEEVPKTNKPALLHRIPPSHEMYLSVPDSSEDIQRGPGAFIIHLLAFLFQTRLQFHNWWFDRRVPIRQPRGFILNKTTVEDFLSHCYKTWQLWDQKERRLITNVLYMHSRAPSYEWDWEWFTIEYMVLDGCWKLAELRHNIKAQKKGRIKHEDRVRILCDAFQIPYKDDLISSITSLRNDLFHETLWDGSQPCTAVGIDAFQKPRNLHRLNQRIIPALLGYNTSFIKTSWWMLNASVFEQPNYEEH